MERGDFLSISPTELKFPFELKKQSSCTLQLTNETNHYIAFKVKTTSPKKYCVRPNTGIVLPWTPCDVTVTMQAQKEAPPDMQCKDKFLIQSVVASTWATVEDITEEMFNKEPGKVVKEFELRVIYVLANLASSSSRATMDDLGVSSKDLFSIHPTELYFPFELKKQNSCHLQLTSKTEQYIAFQVKTTNPKKYCVRPNMGIVFPGKTCDVTVTMQAQMEAPPDMQCKDKFLVQSVVASTGATKEDITKEMFNKESGKVEEFKLRVIYVPANPPLAVPEGSEEGSSPRASLLDNGYLNASLLEADSLRPALGHEMPLSSQPEQTRSKNVPNGGSGLTLHFPGDSNTPSTKVAINFHISITDQGGHTFNQYAGSGDSRQYQAGDVSGGTITQGNVPFAAGGGANNGR